MNTIKCNLHTHTHFSDGVGTPEEFILLAIERGYRSIGFSEHAYNSYDLNCRISLENLPRYQKEIRRLRERYAGRLEVYCGIENDYFEPLPARDFDFTIGSTHFVRDGNGAYYSIDDDAAILQRAIDALGGVPALLERYYAQVTAIAREQKPDILGHFDLITKLNDCAGFFRTDTAHYRRLVRTAVDAVAKSGCIVEVNSGGMFRGYLSRPYPSREILADLLRLEVPVILSADAHCPEALVYYFDEMAELLRDVGYRSVKQMYRGEFVDIPLY